MSKTKTKLNPLERMEGYALAVMLPPWSYKSELLTPKTERLCTTFILKVTILIKAINRNKPFLADDVVIL